MFKIKFSRDMMNEDADKRNRITGIRIVHGYYCMDCCWCIHGSKCRYRKGFKFHNISVRIHNFFQYRIHVKLPHILYVGKYNTNLSGTSKCPFNMSRRYTCYDCIHCEGQDKCGNRNYIELPHKDTVSDDTEWPECKCKFFEKSAWADNYDRKTGRML